MVCLRVFPLGSVGKMTRRAVVEGFLLFLRQLVKHCGFS